MNLEKEILKLTLMGYRIKTVRTIDGGCWFSHVIPIDEVGINLKLYATPALTKDESIEHAIKDFLRFNRLIEKYTKD
jgi:hypothetical protein